LFRAACATQILARAIVNIGLSVIIAGRCRAIRTPIPNTTFLCRRAQIRLRVIIVSCRIRTSIILAGHIEFKTALGIVIESQGVCADIGRVADSVRILIEEVGGSIGIAQLAFKGEHTRVVHRNGVVGGEIAGRLLRAAFHITQSIHRPLQPHVLGR
jgi:hypothetical protein